MLTREAHDWTQRFRICADALKNLPGRQAFLDGEIVALKEDGTSDFQLLQNSLKEHAPVKLVYFIFDLLYLDGRGPYRFAAPRAQRGAGKTSRR